MWIRRDVETLLRRMAKQFPAVLVTGARQAGKTSLLRHLLRKASYLSLDSLQTPRRRRARPSSCSIAIRRR